MFRKVLIFFVTSIVVYQLDAQLILDPNLDEKITKNQWNSDWVTVPGSPAYSFGVYLFRNTIEIKEVPDEYIIHVSADNRYNLYVNGEPAGLGPARGEPDNWYFETYNLASMLTKGKNVITAEVWNYGTYKPAAQISVRTGFIVLADKGASSELSTPGNWKCLQSDAYKSVSALSENLGTMMLSGTGLVIDGTTYPWGWTTLGYDDSGWANPEVLYPGVPKGVGTSIRYGLIPRNIPAMKMEEADDPILRLSSSPNYAKTAIKKPLNGLVIPPNSDITLLLDQQELIISYPSLILSGGKGGRITVGYAESLYSSSGKKVHRDSVKDLEFRGLVDRFFPDGSKRREFKPLWFRTYRYIELKIQTSIDPLTIHTFKSTRTGYPFEEKAWFDSPDTSLNKIWETGWRTSAACAHEAFFDCPYYEQLQYTGDARIQALISLYVSGDDRLMKKSIRDGYNSIIPEGLTQSRYPAEPRQVIPTYSLFWISMIHDYLWHRNDYLFAAEYLVSIQHILNWFEIRIDRETGMVGALEYWPFVDWTEEWPWDNKKRIGGIPPGGQDGNSSIITLQYAMTLNQAADIFSFYGLETLAQGYLKQSERLTEAVISNCWVEEKEYFADSPNGNSFSQHANALAILAGAVEKNDQALLAERILRDTSLVQASLYFRYYVHRSAIEAGLGNKYLEYLIPWNNMIEAGLTTFAEIPDIANTRSDCHAWSASPIYELLSTVAGVKPGSVGFESVIIEPRPGSLAWLKAGMPHYYGLIELDLKFDKKGGVKGSVTVPPGLKGVFIWDNQVMDLNPGSQRISFTAMDSRFRLKQIENQ